MKKLNKIQINSEKILKDEELLSLRGGTMCVNCLDNNMNIIGGYYTTAYNMSYEDYMFGCNYYYSGTHIALYLGENTNCMS